MNRQLDEHPEARVSELLQGSHAVEITIASLEFIACLTQSLPEVRLPDLVLCRAQVPKIKDNIGTRGREVTLHPL